MADRFLKAIMPIINLRFDLLSTTKSLVANFRIHDQFVSKFCTKPNEHHQFPYNSEKNDNIQSEEPYVARLLRIAIIGVPNAGKSTIINRLVNRRVCSISSKVHTTRCKARAITIHENVQLVFLDTPGLVNSSESQRHNLEYEFHSDSEMALLEADVIGVIHDVSNKWTRHRLDPKVVRLLHLYPRKHSFLILNKIDSMKSKRNLLDLVRILTNGTLAKEISPVQPDTEICYTDSMKGKSKRKNQETESNVARDIEINENDSELLVQRKIRNERGWSHFREVFMVSALNGDGTADVRDYLLYISQPSPWLYPPSQFTDQPSETIVLDTVRSKLLDNLPNEIPYNLTTTIEYFDFGREGSISAVVLVGCPSLRLEKLLVGSRGRRIGAIAQAAEQELQNTFRQPVRLKVVVTSTDRAVSNNPSAR